MLICGPLCQATCQTIPKINYIIIFIMRWHFWNSNNSFIPFCTMRRQRTAKPSHFVASLFFPLSFSVAVPLAFLFEIFNSTDVSIDSKFWQIFRIFVFMFLWFTLKLQSVWRTGSKLTYTLYDCICTHCVYSVKCIPNDSSKQYERSFHYYFLFFFWKCANFNLFNCLCGFCTIFEWIFTDNDWTRITIYMLASDFHWPSFLQSSW